MNGFTPEGYEVPASVGNYFKLKEGANTIRILTSPILGYEYWNVDNKPVRSQKKFEEIPVGIKKDKDGKPTKISHFWAMVVYNYADEAIQIMEITQKTLQKAILALAENPKWGHPKGFDITITKTGEKLDTEYSVVPEPHTPIDPKIAEKFANKKVDLTRLYEGKDPFSSDEKAPYPTQEDEGINIDEMGF